ncbi:hypothetical protein IPZ58_24210 [Streptomyces roseoverticillatus]|uniref:hypothetical protein n=1 Tax=Streptomyces roseoverticillatus TaxID=66429 RepID=UPI001F354994|nr:hypothetical protein [Streptomyces roseoverticillatus]MCF3104671.1 hypothetical protein [Streptomyces roseoverticillatus]
MTSTIKGHRTAATAALLLLLAVLFGPVPGGAQPYAAVTAAPSAHRAAPSSALAAEPVRAEAPDPGPGCRQQDVPLKDAETAVASGHADPVTAPGTARAPLPQAAAPRVSAPRAPPAPVAGCAELLPVLRI